MIIAAVEPLFTDAFFPQNITGTWKLNLMFFKVKKLTLIFLNFSCLSKHVLKIGFELSLY